MDTSDLFLVSKMILIFRKPLPIQHTYIWCASTFSYHVEQIMMRILAKVNERDRFLLLIELLDVHFLKATYPAGVLSKEDFCDICRC